MAIRVLTSSLLRHHRQVRRHFSRSEIAGWRILSIEKQQHVGAPSMLAHRCGFSTLSEQEQNKELDEINSKFAEARDEIELALESKETVYFNEEAETARVAVQAVLGRYQALLAKLGPQEKGAVQRSMGMKMEQLKAEIAQLKED